MEQLVEQLKVVQATAFSFYLKAHYFHWNVTGPSFAEYHKFLGDVYEDVHDSVDVYAELIRALDAYAPGSLVRFAELTRIQDEPTIPTSLNMMLRLESDNQIMITELKYARVLAEAMEKFGHVNYIEDRLQYHDKLGWMLKSFRG